ncbi:MAG: hypothetical protein GY927_22790 [bacterium]|nr:hypothetical protein [bacterium]
MFTSTFIPLFAGRLEGEGKAKAKQFAQKAMAELSLAKSEGLEYELIVASNEEHVHEKVLHVQNVNACGRCFKQWLDRFNGMTTKYLQSYLGWRRWLEKGEDKITPQTTLAAALG